MEMNNIGLFPKIFVSPNKTEKFPYNFYSKSKGNLIQEFKKNPFTTASFISTKN